MPHCFALAYARDAVPIMCHAEFDDEEQAGRLNTKGEAQERAELCCRVCALAAITEHSSRHPRPPSFSEGLCVARQTCLRAWQGSSAAPLRLPCLV
eukprot:1567995-Pleurochrysis_carterae.AAC.1